MNLTNEQSAIADSILQEYWAIFEGLEPYEQRFNFRYHLPNFDHTGEKRMWTYLRAKQLLASEPEPPSAPEQEPARRTYLRDVLVHLSSRAKSWPDESITEELNAAMTASPSALPRSCYQNLARAASKRPHALREPGPLRDVALRILSTMTQEPVSPDSWAPAMYHGVHGGWNQVWFDEPVWVQRLAAQLNSRTEPERRFLRELLNACASSTENLTPQSLWIKKLNAYCAPIDRNELIAGMIALMASLGLATNKIPQHWTDAERGVLKGLVDDAEPMMIGLVRFAAFLRAPELTRAIGRLAADSYRKVPRIGPQAVKVGTAAIRALSQIPDPLALGQLAVLRVRVKQVWAQKSIGAALAAAARREGIRPQEIAELGVPTYDMTGVGLLTVNLGDWQAQLRVANSDDTELRFGKTVKGATKWQATVPAALKSSHGDALKHLKATAKDISVMLRAQRDRIESLYLDDYSWAFGVWRERYLDHPLVGVVARRLIWRVTDGKAEKLRSFMWHEDRFVDAAGSPVAIDTDSAIIRLWHPVEVSPDEAMDWRRFIEDRRICQPFKQAHREVCLVADAERQSRTYSNRYAAHIIRQHQFHALCAERGWKNRLRLCVDAEFPAAARHINRHNIRAEFWIEGIGTEANDTGSFLYLSTDQVRFYPPKAPENVSQAGHGPYARKWNPDVPPLDPVPLEDVPPLVFSEVMRDIDLFVGVASVGNNPEWKDGGPNGSHRTYWQNINFGELSVTGATRRDLLTRLLQRLAISDRCTLSDRFLIVRGNLRTYRIHLGSGNIVMDPDDQYLFFVPTAQNAPDVVLPFEGDRTLSIILSKAFMLAEDDKIKDPSIISQIGRGSS
jgi:hypothetical protein